MAEPTEPVWAEVSDLQTAARQLVRDALLADPRAVEILKSLPDAPPSRSVVECFLKGFKEETEFIKSAVEDGTLDILVEVGGSGDVRERIREVRTLRAVLRDLKHSEPGPGVSKPKRDPGQPSKDRQDDILAVIREARTPLIGREIAEAMRLKGESKIGANLAWMVKNNLLINIPSRGYWPAADDRPV